jgi:hypothetical protein
MTQLDALSSRAPLSAAYENTDIAEAFDAVVATQDPTSSPAVKGTKAELKILKEKIGTMQMALDLIDDLVRVDKKASTGEEKQKQRIEIVKKYFSFSPDELKQLEQSIEQSKSIPSERLDQLRTLTWSQDIKSALSAQLSLLKTKYQDAGGRAFDLEVYLKIPKKRSFAEFRNDLEWVGQHITIGGGDESRWGDPNTKIDGTRTYSDKDNDNTQKRKKSASDTPLAGDGGGGGLPPIFLLLGILGLGLSFFLGFGHYLANRDRNDPWNRTKVPETKPRQGGHRDTQPETSPTTQGVPNNAYASACSPFEVRAGQPVLRMPAVSLPQPNAMRALPPVDNRALAGADLLGNPVAVALGMSAAAAVGAVTELLPTGIAGGAAELLAPAAAIAKPSASKIDTKPEYNNFVTPLGNLLNLHLTKATATITLYTRDPKSGKFDVELGTFNNSVYVDDKGSPYLVGDYPVHDDKNQPLPLSSWLRRSNAVKIELNGERDRYIDAKAAIRLVNVNEKATGENRIVLAQDGTAPKF